MLQPSSEPDSGANAEMAPASASFRTPDSFALEPPIPSLPKGGGAIRGIGEKFTAQSATGTGALSVPLPISPGRAGSQPALQLQYDSGAGNGIFGLGWQLTLPCIARKTDKGLPRYLDRDESDVFVIAGAEDLVPLLDPRTGERVPPQDVRVGGQRFAVRQYRPRVEGLFARIERWTSADDAADCFWRVLDRHNNSQWFGRTPQSRVVDANDATKIFQWWLCLSHDDKGNVVSYEYVADGTQKHLKRACYGNRAPYLPTLHPDRADPPLPAQWMFELVFDFGDHALEDPAPHADRDAPVRSDAFCDYRAGFERRTSNRVERVLMFHHFPDVPEVGASALVRSLRLRYAPLGAPADPQQAGYSQIEAIEPWAHERAANGALLSRAAPPVEFRYSQPRIDTTIRAITAAELPGLPVGTQGPDLHWVDLDGEGLSGVLAEHEGAWAYAANLGEGRFAPSRVIGTTPAKRALSGNQRLVDLDGNGAIDVAEFDGPTPGYYERNDSWTQFVPFAQLPRIVWNDPNLRFIDLSGDGHADALVTEDEVFTWYPSLAREGFGAAEVQRPPQEERDARLVFADGTQTLFLADMCGDGLTDIVRIRNGEVCYWPNLGYGRFGAKVRMQNAPRLDHDDHFDPRRLRLVDIDGSGPTDLIYLGRDGAQVHFNRSGSSWSGVRLVGFPVATLNLDAVQVTDLLGRGTACLVWNSHLPADAAQPVRYIDLMSGTKPHLLVETRNNLGGSTQVEYLPSTHFYLADKAAGIPWATKLPFPVQCVSRVTVRDAWRGTAFSSTYSYHHGHFDGVEREFRGFGRVEQVDIEDFGHFADANSRSPWISADQTLYQPPVKSVTWFHTGIADGRERVLSQFAHEYFPARYRFEGAFRERELPEPSLDPTLHIDEWREALRACKGMVLRQEVYELDIETLTGPAGRHTLVRIFSAATHNCRIERLQPRGPNRHAAFLVTESEALVYQYEQMIGAPGSEVHADPRILHTLTLRVDDLGHALQSVTVGYPRVRVHDDTSLDAPTMRRIRAAQAERHLAYSESRFTPDLLVPASDGPDAVLRHRRLRMPCETLTYELTGIAPAREFYLEPGDFSALRLSDAYAPLDPAAAPVAVPALPFHQRTTSASPRRRCVEHARSVYFEDSGEDVAPGAPLPFGRHGVRGLKYEDYKLALTDELLAAVFRTPATLPGLPADLLAWELRPGATPRALLNDASVSGYLRQEAGGDAPHGQYWLRSGTAGFAADAARRFYLPQRYTDAFGAVTTLEYDALDLYVRRIEDTRGNVTEVVRFDYRALVPVEVSDVNGNRSEVALDIFGMPVAMAVKGKMRAAGWEGDDVEAFAADAALRNPQLAAVQRFCASTTFEESQARAWLARASSRFVYHFGERRDAEGGVVAWATRPASACAIAREIHAAHAGGEGSPLHVSLQCSDGGGSVLMAKQQAEPDISGAPRWIVNGLTVLNNKGKAVKRYEPFFSDRFGCEMPRAEGVTPIVYYDAAGRAVRTDAPDGTFARVEFSPWHSRQFDAGDTVLESAWYAERGAPDPRTPLPRSVAGQVTAPADFRAAWLAARQAGTPTQSHLDSLGRSVLTIVHNRTPDESTRPSVEWSVTDWVWRDQFLSTHMRLDAEGKPLWTRDARGNLVMQHIHPPKPDAQQTDEVPEGSVPAYDITGNLLYQHSMDSGDRWLLNDAAGQPLLAWDVNDVLDAAGAPARERRVAWHRYDRMHRPMEHWLRLGDAAAALVERFEYRDAADAGAGIDIADVRARNLIGQTVVHDDPSGRFEILEAGFAGQVRRERRRFARPDTARTIDWQGGEAQREARLESATFSRQTRHDALGRMVQMANWHRSEDSTAVYRPIYNARGLLLAEDLSVGAQWNDGAPSGGRKSWTAVHGITYDAKGQRTCVRHGNGTETRYDYDARSFRLKQIRTTRPGADLAFPAYRSRLADDRVLQHLQYSYDASGHITEIDDQAWAPVFFRNQSVEARNLYVYDAIGRLIEATGRESASLIGAPQALSDAFVLDAFPAEHALRNYRQIYRYDAAANFIAMQHVASGGSWTRHYGVAADSNRLLRTWTGSDDREAVDYAYDVHGSMLNLANVSSAARIRWDWRDMIEGFDLLGGGHARYDYDIDKQRTRKRIERPGGIVEERLYLDGMELYRRYAPDDSLVEEIESHHLFVEGQRVLLVDDVIATDDQRLKRGILLRYQHGNSLGSATLELDESVQIVSYEEFHPYGATAYQLVGRAVRATSKRYRYTGMERDEESGLNYHQARYLSTSMARWISVDPLCPASGLNAYEYAASSPCEHSDPSGLLIPLIIIAFVVVCAVGAILANPAPAGAPEREYTAEEARDRELRSRHSWIRTGGTAAALVTLPAALTAAASTSPGAAFYGLGGIAAATEGAGELSDRIDPSGTTRVVVETGMEIGLSVAASSSRGRGSGGGRRGSSGGRRARRSASSDPPAETTPPEASTTTPSVTSTVAADAAAESAAVPEVAAPTPVPAPAPTPTPTAPTPLAHGPDLGPNPRGLPPRSPVTGEREFDTWVGGLFRRRIRPGESSDAITQSLRRLFQRLGRRYGTIDGPPTKGPVVVGHTEGRAHVLTPRGGVAEVAPQTRAGNGRWSPLEKAYADRVRGYNETNPADVRPVRPRGAPRN